MFEDSTRADPACEVRGQCSLDLRPGKPARQHRQWVAKVDYLDQEGVEEISRVVVSGMRKSLRNQLPVQRILGNRWTAKSKESSVHAGCGGFAGPTIEPLPNRQQKILISSMLLNFPGSI